MGSRPPRLRLPTSRSRGTRDRRRYERILNFIFFASRHRCLVFSEISLTKRTLWVSSPSLLSLVRKSTTCPCRLTLALVHVYCRVLPSFLSLVFLSRRRPSLRLLILRCCQCSCTFKVKVNWNLGRAPTIGKVRQGRASFLGQTLLEALGVGRSPSCSGSHHYP